MQIDLQTTLRKNGPAPREEALWDIRQIKIALNRLGYYMPEKEEGFDDDYDMDFDRALRAFQWAKRVPRDDSVGPGSLTERVLNEELAGFNDRRFYIWRTVGDEKVRGSHAARNGKVFQWAAPPEGGHPREDHNCRCWAEPVAPIYHPWIQHLEDVRAGRSDPHPLLDSGHFLNNINTPMAQGLNSQSSGKFPVLDMPSRTTPVMMDGKDPLDPFGGDIKGGFLGGGGGRSSGGAQKNFIKSRRKAIQSLRKKIKKHEQKIKDYRKNPEVYDNKGYLKAAPNPEVRKKIIRGRIRKLEKEIKKFEKEIEKIKGKMK